MRIHTESDGMRDHAWQLAVQERFTAIEADIPDSESVRIFEQIAHGIPGQVVARHEVTTIPTAEAAEIAVGSDGDFDAPGLSVDEPRHDECGTVERAFDRGVGCDGATPDARHLFQGWSKDAAKPATQAHLLQPPGYESGVGRSVEVSQQSFEPTKNEAPVVNGPKNP
jgi:hypothetical protein